MNKKMRELLNAINEKTIQAKFFMGEENKDLDKASALLDEVDALKKEYDAEERLFNLSKNDNTPNEEEMKTAKTEKIEKSAIEKFAEDARNGFIVKAGKLAEGVPADGGYIVPEDIQTKINEYKTAKASLLDIVTVEKVTTNKGQRTFKKRAQQTGFTKVGEGGKITAKSTPQFERLSYEIEKYAGYLPVTNELLADSDQNVANTIIEWLGDESRVTANKLILEEVKKKEETDLKNLDGIKKALNVTLGQAFKPTARIITNDDGLQYLDTLKDSTNRYLLAPMPGDTMKMGLQVGANTIPVEVIPNADMPTDKKKIPFLVGDLEEGIVYWDRQLISINISTTAVIGDLNAFEEDLTLYRAIEREDVTLRDKDAFVRGFITSAE
ncbi:phage major capsid protein [Peptostreptococcus sp. D1]|uniref:phage major capsid protein n=1 Tax=Peptostreptococcus sp. D1 TaxID=72304 RepID=UPI0008EBB3A8|nr:phage major capsid protein [Peptostreptococcus sp. D1]SFE84139.1 phage major capsid protein, HK97 family [Peptostreptococcus sp. D1]